MNITIEQAREVIKTLKEEDKKLETFSSHKFIGRYIENFESEYIALLVRYKNNPKNTKKIFHNFHFQIGNFLSDNQDELGISHIGDVKDMNIHYRETSCAEWRLKSSK